MGMLRAKDWHQLVDVAASITWGFLGFPCLCLSYLSHCLSHYLWVWFCFLISQNLIYKSFSFKEDSKN